MKWRVLSFGSVLYHHRGWIFQGKKITVRFEEGRGKFSTGQSNLMSLMEEEKT